MSFNRSWIYGQMRTWKGRLGSDERQQYEAILRALNFVSALGRQGVAKE